MARRSDYPFHKSDTKFGTNLIASLFSIPISLGVAAMSDALRTLPSSFSRNGTRKTSAVTERTIVILACLGVAVFLSLGIYWVTLPDEYFMRNLLGKVLILIYAPSFLVLTILIVNDIKQKRIALETRNGYVWAVIDDDLWGILYQSLNIELYFHFTRPYLTKKEYQTIKSPRFLTKIETYDEYDKAWYQYYWYYSFQMKVHDTIKDVLLTSDESLQVMSESEYYRLIQKRLTIRLNSCEKDIFLNEIGGDVASCCSYDFEVKTIWPYRNDEKELARNLDCDLKNRKEGLLKRIYKQYGGAWKPELLNQLDVWRSK